MSNHVRDSGERMKNEFAAINEKMNKAVDNIRNAQLKLFQKANEELKRNIESNTISEIEREITEKKEAIDRLKRQPYEQAISRRHKPR